MCQHFPEHYSGIFSVYRLQKISKLIVLNCHLALKAAIMSRCDVNKTDLTSVLIRDIYEILFLPKQNYSKVVARRYLVRIVGCLHEEVYVWTFV